MKMNMAEIPLVVIVDEYHIWGGINTIASFIVDSGQKYEF